MTPEAWISLVAQVPIVAAFIWYSLENQKRQDAAMQRRDDAYEKRNEAIVAAINASTETQRETNKLIVEVAQKLAAHDARLGVDR